MTHSKYRPPSQSRTCRQRQQQLEGTTRLRIPHLIRQQNLYRPLHRPNRLTPRPKPNKPHRSDTSRRHLHRSLPILHHHLSHPSDRTRSEPRLEQQQVNRRQAIAAQLLARRRARHARRARSRAWPSCWRRVRRGNRVDRREIGVWDKWIARMCYGQGRHSVGTAEVARANGSITFACARGMPRSTSRPHQYATSTSMETTDDRLHSQQRHAHRKVIRGSIGLLYIPFAQDSTPRIESTWPSLDDPGGVCVGQPLFTLRSALPLRRTRTRRPEGLSILGDSNIQTSFRQPTAYLERRQQRFFLQRHVGLRHIRLTAI